MCRLRVPPRQIGRSGSCPVTPVSRSGRYNRSNRCGRGGGFLRALVKDLGLRDFKVTSNAAGIAVSGECTLIGIWEDSGIYISIEQPSNMAGNVLLYRTVRNMKDYKGGYNRFLNRRELARMSYSQLLNTLLALRKEVAYDWAA